MTRTYSERKQKYRAKMEKLLEDYQNILIVSVDFVGSSQLQQTRMKLRGTAVILMGKNTIMRKVIREAAEKNPALGQLLPYIVGNIGFVFTNGDLNEVRKVVTENKVPAQAKSGVIAPIDVIVPAGPTGLDPGQTSFFQALNIATKITRGSIEIISNVKVITKDEKVTASAVSLLSKMDIKPFFFGIEVQQVYENGTIYDASVLDLDDNAMLAKFFNGVQMLASLSLAIHYPTLAALPHLFANAFKQLLAISVATDYTFEESQKYKEYLADPAAYAAANFANVATTTETKDEAPAAAAAAEESEEEDDEPAAGLFGDDDDDY